MIRVTNIRNLDSTKQNQWAIVRSLKSKSPWMTQVAELSPSTGLFHKYLQLKERGEWNEKSFKDIYVPWFLRDMKEYGAPMLNRVWLMNKQGIDIDMACFCTDETFCHRSVVAGLLQGAGCQVITDTGADYSQYFEMFKQL